MSDASTPGDRLDTKLTELREAVDAVRAALEEGRGNIRARAADLVDAVFAKIDEVQAAWDERGEDDIEPPTDPPPSV